MGYLIINNFAAFCPLPLMWEFRVAFEGRPRQELESNVNYRDDRFFSSMVTENPCIDCESVEL